MQNAEADWKRNFTRNRERRNEKGKGRVWNWEEKEE